MDPGRKHSRESCRPQTTGLKQLVGSTSSGPQSQLTLESCGVHHPAVNTAAETMHVSTSQDGRLDPKELALGRLNHKLLLVMDKRKNVT